MYQMESLCSSIIQDAGSLNGIRRKAHPLPSPRGRYRGLDLCHNEECNSVGIANQTDLTNYRIPLNVAPGA